MSDYAYLIVHKDHPINLSGVNSGAETATLWLARSIAHTGRKVVVAAQLVGSEETKWGVEFWDLGADFDVASAIVRARTLGSYRLIAACRAISLQLTKDETGCVSRHFIAHDPSSGALGVTPKVLQNLVDGIICVSVAQKDLFVREGVKSDLITVIPNGADLELFKPGSSRDFKKIVFAGALVADKGVDILVQAFATVRRSCPQATLDIYGSGAMWGRPEPFDFAQLERAIPGLKFHGSVSQERVAKALGTAGLCVIPSRWFDSFPLVAVEAQAAGCPVLAFDVGGIRESIVPGETGELVATVSEEALAAGMIALLNSEQKLRSMSARAVDLVAQKFSWEKVAGQVIDLCQKTTKLASSTLIPRRLGIMTTWNQECGLATYAQYLFSNFEPGSFVIFSEDSIAPKTRSDERFVKRCWRRGNGDFSRLKSALRSHKISALHINLHNAKMFPQAEFTNFINEIRNDGIFTILHLHSTFTLDPAIRQCVTAVDRVIVNSEQNRLEVIANGAVPRNVEVLLHGVHLQKPLSSSEREALRDKLGIPCGEKVIAAFGFIQPHKGMEGMLEVVSHLEQRGITARGYILGIPMPGDQASDQYHKQLRNAVTDLGLEDKIVFSDRFLTDDEVSEWLLASDLVLMNYRSQHYESSGACSLAVGAGAVVATSIAPPFAAFGDAVWHITAGYPPASTAELLLTNSELRAELKDKAARYAEEHAWPKAAQALKGLYSRFGFYPSIMQMEERVVKQASDNRWHKGNALKVLIQNRSGTFTARGGDTVVIEKTVAGLRNRGVEVTVDVEGRENPANYSLVHLFNFAIPDMLRTLGERAKQAGVPFVVTTLCEDVPSFHNQSHAMARALVQYQTLGQDKNWWQVNRPNLKAVVNASRFQNDWVAENAAALITNGSTESAVIRRDYPSAGRIVEIMLGREVGAVGSVEKFVQKYGVRDFVLCVGRLESRKNQLMLLKALEDSDLTVVLAGGGFSYQPDYAQAVRSFKRKGQTLILDRLEPEMLASAYEACRVHVLPSWYELPGLVSLEAAFHRKNVVVTDCGTIRDYLGDHPFYCEPWSESSIYNAVVAAYYSPLKPGLAELVQKYTWDSVAQRTLELYQSVCKPFETAASSIYTSTNVTQEEPFKSQQSDPIVISYDAAPGVSEFADLLDRGEIAARGREFAKAHDLLGQAERLNPNSARLLKARGAVYLAENNNQSAAAYFERAYKIDPHEPKIINGLGMCEMRRGDTSSAYSRFVEALRINENDTVAIMNLIPCAYALNRFQDLESVLKRYLTIHPDDLQMRYCYAGCLYKMGNFAEASEQVMKVLQSNPTHAGAVELRDILAKQPKGAWSTKQTDINAYSTGSSLLRSDNGASAGSVINTVRSVGVDTQLGALEEAKRKRELNKVKEGVELILARIDLTPAQREHAILLKAEASVMTGGLKEAGQLYSQILQSNPNSARALCGQAVLAAHSGNWGEAERLFELARSIMPSYDVPMAGLGLCAWQKGRSEEAWSYYRRALELNPENGRALLGAMQVGYPLNKHLEVESLLKSYLEIHPADLEFVYSLAGCFFAQNKLDEAIEQVNKITLFKPDDLRAKELKQMIEAKKHSSTSVHAQ